MKMRNQKAAAAVCAAALAAQLVGFFPEAAVAADPPQSGFSIIGKQSGKLLTVDADGNVCQRGMEQGLLQQWDILAQNDGSYVLQCGGLALTVENGASDSGANLTMAKADGSASQRFHIHQDNGAFYLTSVCSSDVCAVEIKGKSSTEGANAQQYKYQGNANQQFEIAVRRLKGDLNSDLRLNAADLTLLKNALLRGASDEATAIGDVNADGVLSAEDAVMLRDYLLTELDVFPKIWYAEPFSLPASAEPDGRLTEYLSRGVNAVSTGKNVFVSWRSLVDDPDGMAFNVYRTTDGNTLKVNDAPLKGGTNFTDTSANLSKNNTYFVKAVVNGKETDTDGDFTLPANAAAQAQILDIRPGGTIHFVWVGDFDGDGNYDYLVDRCTDNHQKLEAYRSDGTYLWTADLGYNSENKNNISPGASTIDVGMWDGATVYDMDCDGYADVLLRIADGVTFGDGTVYHNSTANAQAIAVLDGRTGALKAEAPVPDDYIKIGPMACMMEIGYLDGIHPSVVCWLKNRNPNKDFNSITAAFGYTDGTFKMQWKYDNSLRADGSRSTGDQYNHGYAEAHQIRVADVDYDGKDEVLHMGYAINGDGTLKYHIDEIIHGDRWFVGSFRNGNNGKEMLGYGVQQRHIGGLLEYIYNAATGEMLWTNYSDTEELIDVGRGNVGDIDPRYEGFECWSFQGLYSNEGKKISENTLYPSIRLWWDGDVLSESYNDGKIEKWDYQNRAVNRLATTWKMTDCVGSDRGAPMFYGDIYGDWREEVIMTSGDFSKLVILSTADETDLRLYSLSQNPCYRNCMTAKGYYQSHMLDYYLGTDMEMPERPVISVIPKP